MAFVESHLKRVGGERGGEDMRGREFVPEIGAAVRGRHQGHDYGLGSGLVELRELLLLTDPFAIGGVGFHQPNRDRRRLTSQAAMVHPAPMKKPQTNQRRS